jgi:CubicO group peptidase (beta-lactamase class C family)
MRVRTGIGWVGLAIALATAPASAQSTSADSVSRWVDSIFAPYAEPSSPGCAVGVIEKGTLALAKGYGMADLEHGAPIGPDTRFYIASISKQFTAMSIILLAQDGRLSFDDSIQKWVPEVPSFGEKITLRNLLQHTSGLRDYFTLLALSGWPTDGQLSEQQLLSLVSRQKDLNFKPGDEFLYSNTGYALLAIVVKRVSGKTLREYAAEHIFKPLGMSKTMFRDDHTMLVPKRALGYQLVGSTFHLSQPQFDVVGDGGVYTTVEDLAKWDANFKTGKVGGKQAISLLQTPGRLNDGQPIPYAFAISVGEFHGLKTFSHSGSYGGYRASFLRVPDKDVSVITLCNTSDVPNTIAEQVASVVLNFAAQKTTVASIGLPNSSIWLSGTAQSPNDSTAVRLRAGQLARVAGNYYSSELDLPVTIVARENALILQRAQYDELRFSPVSDDLFTNSDQMLLKVVRDDRGNVTGLRLTINRVRDLEFSKR